ncbi:hypothetical protein BMS3Abin11_02416 [bacterium BMS3Abin11]|nr:hypothetical protein BMS3Abin11_02416 [bacterium BMS3Abin11]
MSRNKKLGILGKMQDLPPMLIISQQQDRVGNWSWVVKRDENKLGEVLHCKIGLTP